MSDGDATGRDHPRRPLLGGGERLREDAERLGGGRPPHPPYGFEQAQSILKPQMELLAQQVISMPERLRARHVVIEATMLPNYLAGSHFPSELLAAADLYPIGTRQTTSVYKTAKRERKNQPTKSLLLAGPPDSVTALAELVSGDISAGRRRLWEQIREFSRIGLPDPNTVVRRVPVSHGDGELITWEAVLNPIGRTDAQRHRWA
ncbi:MAG: hypothetical protein M3418_11660, partial [Gemmatimonadota bacterium]|nr:hypothetical protein [Gemmatimonadota bacterium]